MGIDLGVTFAEEHLGLIWLQFRRICRPRFLRRRYTDQGPFIKLRIKADQDTFKDLGSEFRSLTGR